MAEERKLVTVLFVDVVDSTAFASDTDPEVVRGIMDRFFARVSQIAGAHGGTRRRRREMTDNTRPQGPPATNGRAIDLMAELISVLNGAEKPLSLGELSLRLGRNFRSIAWVLAAAGNAGTVDRLEGGRYALSVRPALLELYALVHECETRWELATSSALINDR